MQDATTMHEENKKRSSRVRVTLDEIQSKFYLIGPAFLLAIFFWVHYQMGLPKLVGDLSFPDLVCLISCVVLFGYIAASFRKRMTSLLPLLAFVGFVCGAVSMICLMLIDSAMESTWPRIVGAAFFAIFLITYGLLWLNIYERQNIIMVIIYLLFSTVLGYLFSWLVLGLESLRAVCALVGMAALTLLFFLLGFRRNSPVQDVSAKEESYEHLPVGFIFISFAFSVSYMYAIMSNGLGAFHSFFNWDLPLASLVLLVFCFLMRTRLTLIRLFSLAAPLMVVGLLLALFIDLNSSVLYNLFHLGFFVYLVFILVLYCGCAQKRNINTLRLACFLILGIFVGCFVGRLLYPALFLFFPDFVQQAQSVTSILIIGLLVLCTIYGSQYIYRLFGEEKTPRNYETLGANEKPGLSAEEITVRYGLSERENEVLLLLLEGKSATQIAKEMVVAHGTIKAHIRNIYKKIGIHQRDELFALSSKA